VALIVVIALAVALLSRGQSGNHAAATTSPSSSGPAVGAAQRAAAQLADCPQPTTPTTPSQGRGPWTGLTLDCLATGRPVDVAAALAGKPALLNLWAYWCGPCAQELPALRQYAERAGTAITVLTVHSDPEENKALARLADLGVHLPGVEDAGARVRAAVGAPAVLPISVLVRADGSIAKVVVRPFTDTDDITRTVAEQLGVRV
jgi:thiol-disulfide isomerase/thioredoxin